MPLSNERKTYRRSKARLLSARGVETIIRKSNKFPLISPRYNPWLVVSTVFLTTPLFQVMEDLAYAVLLRKRFNYLESIPGVLLPHPSSSAFPFNVEGCYGPENTSEFRATAAPPQPMEVYNHLSPPVRITPSMSSLEALLSKLPPVCPMPPPTHFLPSCLGTTISVSQPQRSDEPVGVDKIAKEELDNDNDGRERSINLDGQSSGSMACLFFNAAKPTEGL